jgi:hypothetical protein
MKDAADFFSWVGVALVALLPVINPVSGIEPYSRNLSSM